MIGFDFIGLLDALTLALLAEFPPPTIVAEGTMQGIVLPPRHEVASCTGCGKVATLFVQDGGHPPWRCSACEIADERLPRGLIPCPTCGRPERPGAVHFPSNTATRPCAGSWGRR